MIKNVIAIIGCCFLLYQGTSYSENTGLLYNSIYQLSGSHDTLSLLSGKYDKLSMTYAYSLSFIPSIDSSIISNDANWKSFPFEKNQFPRDNVFGNGLSVICFDTTEGNQTNTVKKINHSSNKIDTLTFSWNDELKNNTEKYLLAFSTAFASGNFYFACYDGGLVRWNPNNNTMSVLTPGSSGSVGINQFTGIDDTLKRVTWVETIKDYLVVTSPSTTYLYSLIDSTWTSYANTALDQNVTIKEFICSFADGNSSGHPLYSIANVTKAGGVDTTVVIKYTRKESGWRIMIDRQVDGITFGPKGYIYTMSYADSTEITVYRDTLGDSGVIYKPYPESDYNIAARLITRLIKGDEDAPAPVINDMQFIPTTDSSGIFWVATSSGLFLSRNEIPGKSDSSLTCIKRLASVKGGLEQVFASPGVLKTDEVVYFIYNLSKDAKVTIRIYDYNMDLVKTVIEKQSRPAGNHGYETGRSNLKKFDNWDGTNSNGKTVAPGVYYYKITTDNGDRAFGKIVVAK